MALLALAACQRTDNAARQGTSGEPAAAQPAAASAAPAPAQPGEAPAEGVLRAYVWECDGGLTLNVRNLYRENAVSVELHEGARKLPLVASASGAKYADETITFWSKGGTATFERKGSPAVRCTEARAKSLLADARLRGVAYRALGNEPGWLVEIGPGTSLSYLAGYGQTHHEFDDVTRSGDDAAGAIVFAGAQGQETIRVTLKRETCIDDMSGEEFAYRALVEFAGKELRGCAAALRQ